MLDIGFSEILLIFVLGLIVLGPQKLPRVAAQVGRWIGRARAMARQFREQLEEEINVEETRKKSPKPSSPTSPGEDSQGGGGGGLGSSGDSGTTAATGAATGTPSPDETSSGTSVGEGPGGPQARASRPDSGTHSSAEAPHLDLTNEPWPYVTPVPPPEVTDIFGDVLKTPVPGIGTAASEAQAGASEGAAASGASRVPPPPAPAPSPQVHWPHDHEIPEATTEQVSPEAPLTTHEQGP